MRFDVNKLHQAIDEWSMRMPEENIRVNVPDNSKKERTHLGLSIIGKKCQREVFYSFRKITKPKFDPRILRLFQRGHREEFFFIHMLREVGISIYNEDPATGKQFKVSDFEGHLAGSMDSVGRDRDLLYVDEDRPFLLEYKTYNDDRFKKLKKNGVKENDIQYYTQMQGYLGYDDRLGGALFCAVNKNNDELHFQWVTPDAVSFEMIQERGELIINATKPPLGISQRKSHWECKFCDFRDHCFKDRLPSDRSCRSCVHARPAEKGTWVCGIGHEFGEVCEDWEDVNR